MRFDPFQGTLPLHPARRPIALALSSMLLASCGGGDSSGGPGASSQSLLARGGNEGPMQLRTVSNRADLISGGDALVEVQAPASMIASGVVQVTLNGTDVSPAFVRQGEDRLLGRVSGLREGSNVLEAAFRGGPAARLEVTNAPRQGPVLSGAQTRPFYCATPVPEAAHGTTPATNGSGLGGPPDANCNIPTEFTLYYRTTAAAGNAPGQCSLNLPDPVWNSNGITGAIPPQPAAPANPCWKPYTVGSTPADMASATTAAGLTVPFIVRLERGTMNRGIYDIAVLFDPAKPWTPVAPQAAWNAKVYYSFGVSTGQPRRQARSTIAWSGLEEQLRRGYLVVQNSMTDSSRNSNRVMMSETVMMMKEHIVDTYGRVKYTLGTGCSGGSINSNMNASIMPGLLDGVITTCTFPDSETTAMEVGDCTLLVEAYQKMRATPLWSGLPQAQVDAKKAAINGHPDPSGCHAWFNAFGSNGKAGVYLQRVVANAAGLVVTLPARTNNCELPNDAVYDPADPAKAALPRCNAWSWAESIWGRVPGSVAANDTRDNEGVQYGLKALLSGAITPEEFVVVNEAVGGTDRDSTPRAARSSADLPALRTAYRAGIVASGRQLANTAIIDMRGWDDSNITVPPGQVAGVNPIPIHHQWYSFAVRDRLVREAGDADNQALWRFASTGLTPPGTMFLDGLDAMDQWLLSLVADTRGKPLAGKVRDARPASTRDFCLIPGDATNTKVFDPAVCDADPFLRPSASPRQVAGGPRSEDILKCRLKPLDRADYGAAAFSEGQWARLQAVFATGVCDWKKPGVGQQLAESPLSFAAGPGGLPLPDAPVARRK
ncbi:DUF6351 family protein [Ramlibacter monticola]|uniref:DUF6351 domain-containing protein n=1 Tax=Ramlibacter monticola TaxID=1926872 RepID=A0A936YXD2_9BURK|nr:DUF6351 family protein [Ramlibacter monticola]MBL0389680.1 hypothetical protein [Ramlibacter monticola]